MANPLIEKLPGWLKSLWEMENELRNSARNGLFLRRDDAANHLAEARRHFEEALQAIKGVPPADRPQTPLSKDGEV
jgi:hypothetical protein